MTKKLIQGEIPKKRSIIDWSPEKLLQFVKFAAFFVEDETDSFKVTEEKIKSIKVRGMFEDFWEEFLDRIDCDKPKKFSMRLVVMTRVVLSWLIENPHAVTNEMRSIMEKTQRLSWCLDAIKEKETKIGAEVLSFNDKETTDNTIVNAQTKGITLKTPEVRYANSLNKMASLLEELVGSVDRKQFKHMPIDKKLRAIDSALRTLEKATRGKQSNKMVFKNLIINKSGRDELEGAILNYNQEQ